MARYIDTNVLTEIIKYYYEHTGGQTTNAEHYAYGIVLQEIDRMPTADVVEVVRCKDCDVPHNNWLGCPHLNGLIPPPDFYCAKGTPKERGGE